MAKTEKKKFFTRVGDWFRGMKSELKKVVWPTTKQTVNNTGVVLAVCAASAIVLGGFDWLAQALVRVLIELLG